MQYIPTFKQKTQADIVESYIPLLELSEDWETDIIEHKRENLIKFCKLTVECILSGEYPDCKMGRWTGFIQSAMVGHKVITVEGERDRTRQLFHREYLEKGLEPPKTREI